MYHPLLMQCFNNPALQVSCGESEMNYKVIKNSDKKVVEIQNNNIKKNRVWWQMHLFKKE